MINGVISLLIWGLAFVTLPITTLLTTCEPPSKVYGSLSGVLKLWRSSLKRGSLGARCLLGRS